MSDEKPTCRKCGEPEGSTIHAVDADHREIRMAAHVFEEPPPVPPYRLKVDISAEDLGYVMRVLEEVLGDLAQHGMMEFRRAAGGGGGSHCVTSFSRDVDPGTYCEELVAWHLRMLERDRRAEAARSK